MVGHHIGRYRPEKRSGETTETKKNCIRAIDIRTCTTRSYESYGECYPGESSCGLCGAQTAAFSVAGARDRCRTPPPGRVSPALATTRAQKALLPACRSRSTTTDPAGPQLDVVSPAALLMPESSFLKGLDSLASPLACACGQHRKSVQIQMAAFSSGKASDANRRAEGCVRTREAFVLCAAGLCAGR